jgi:hypothetical protein
MITTLLRKAGLGEPFSYQTVCGAFLALCFYLLPLSTSYAQVATSYNFSEASGVAYTELSPITSTPVVNEGVAFNNTISAGVSIGFDFHFDGTDYSQVNISENGFITFGAAPTATNYSPISTGTYSGAISGYGYRLQKCIIYYTNL